MRLFSPIVGVGSGPDLRLAALLSEKQMGYFWLRYVFLPHPSPKCFPVLIYLAKEVCGERHQTGNSCHSCCLQRLFFKAFSCLAHLLCRSVLIEGQGMEGERENTFLEGNILLLVQSLLEG